MKFQGYPLIYLLRQKCSSIYPIVFARFNDSSWFCVILQYLSFNQIYKVGWGFLFSRHEDPFTQPNRTTYRLTLRSKYSIGALSLSLSVVLMRSYNKNEGPSKKELRSIPASCPNPQSNVDVTVSATSGESGSSSTLSRSFTDLTTQGSLY